MNNAVAATENNTLTVSVEGMTLTYSPETDSRVLEAIDGKLFAKTPAAAQELAGELRAWGVKQAVASAYAVVFWD